MYGARWGTGHIEGNTKVYDCSTTKLYTQNQYRIKLNKEFP